MRDFDLQLVPSSTFGPAEPHSFWQEVVRHYYVLRHLRKSSDRVRSDADAAKASTAQEANAMKMMVAASAPPRAAHHAPAQSRMVSRG